MYKNLTVVFPIYFDESVNNFLVMMGKQAPGKRLEGVRNGYGGKAEMGEEVLNCAVRELYEETSLDIKKEVLIFVGDLIENDKKVFFYIFFTKEKFELLDNTEFVDNKWFVFNDYDKYLGEMLPNEGLMSKLYEVLWCLKRKEKFTPFSFNFSENKKLQQLTKKIYQ